MKNFIATRVASVYIILLLTACAQTQPFRTTLVAPGQIDCPYNKASTIERCANVTPEIAQSAYELHFVEYDDQGWPYPQPSEVQLPVGEREWNQTEHLMKRLQFLLSDERKNLSIILYVHGWKHDAKSDDRDVIRFRQLLQSASKLEQNQSTSPRTVVGIYVGWRGKSWDLPEYMLNLSFWSRKAAALRISHGSAQELFSRLRTVQQFYNSPAESPNCAKAKSGEKTTDGCRIRSLMIGHSFGAWILYAATSGPLIEVLNMHRDLSGDTGRFAPAEHQAEKTKQERAARLADMIVLVNPAFEASRYEPLHQAAIHFQTNIQQPPLLVSITSTADVATKNSFPAGRFFNTIFEHPVTSEQQELAMKRTPGHIERYLTHQLVGTDTQVCTGWKPPGALTSNDGDALRKNKAIEEQNSLRFFTDSSDSNGLLRPGWTREFCGGTELTQLTEADVNQNRNPNSVIWNIQTNETLIKSHSDIMEPKFLEFVRQLYDDTTVRLEH